MPVLMMSDNFFLSLSILYFSEGPFQSDALLVPEGCLFDHIHNASRCWPFVRWNQTGAAACQDRGMQMRSFAMLLPCGISLFSGVEFVCCPKHFKRKLWTILVACIFGACHCRMLFCWRVFFFIYFYQSCKNASSVWQVVIFRKCTLM